MGASEAPQTTSTAPPQAIPAPTAVAGAEAPQTAAATLAQACKPGPWGPVQLNTHIFNEDARALAVAFGKDAADAGVTTVGIENVTTSAARNGAATPIPWPQPTFIYHTKAEEGCATALAAAFNSAHQGAGSVARQLPHRLRATPGVIELWLPATMGAPGG